MADLAVQGSEGKTDGVFCARCFAHVASGEAYCPECGAPTGEASEPGTDSAVHGELAQANLLRLRGDLNGSEKALLAILRRFPNDPLAHEMLGDVCAERGERDRAIEWYELALDLAPASPEIRRKMQETEHQIDAQETADTAETLGLPATTPPAAWWPLAAAGAILVLAILVAAWPRSSRPATIQAVVEAPLTDVKSTTTVPTPVATTNPTPTPEVAPVVAGGVEEDRRLLTDLQGQPDGSHVQSVSLDPRTQAIVVTFEVGENDDARALAITLGRETLSAAPAAATVTLRGVRAGSLTFAADFSRTALDSPDPLTKVWPSAPGEPAPGTPTNTTPPATSGTPASGGTTGTIIGTSTTGSAPTGTTSGSTTPKEGAGTGSAPPAGP